MDTVCAEFWWGPVYPAWIGDRNNIKSVFIKQKLNRRNTKINALLASIEWRLVRNQRIKE